VTDVREFLRNLGVTQEEMEAAERQGPDALRLLLLDRVLLQDVPRYTQTEVAERAGVPLEMARKFWLAMGFVEPAPDERVFTDSDLEALKTAAELIALQITHPILALQQTRVMGLSMSRVAESAISAWEQRRVMPLRAEEDPNDLDVDEETIATTQKLLESNERFLVYVWRRHLAAAAKRGAAAQMTATDEIPLRGIGFADLVGFTKISQDLEDNELAELVDYFETSAHETITSLGGRLVKMIGDEVMFAAERPDTIANIGLALAERHEQDEKLPSVRVGLAWGPVLAREGDYYGPTVNLSNRMVKAARPGTVLINDGLQAKLAERTDLSIRRVPAPPLKGIGRVRVWRIRQLQPGEARPKPATLVGEARETVEDFREGAFTKVAELAEGALLKASLATDGALEKASDRTSLHARPKREKREKKPRKASKKRAKETPD
jgi:adenylate cyclase